MRSNLKVYITWNNKQRNWSKNGLSTPRMLSIGKKKTSLFQPPNCKFRRNHLRFLSSTRCFFYFYFSWVKVCYGWKKRIIVSTKLYLRRIKKKHIKRLIYTMLFPRYVISYILYRCFEVYSVWYDIDVLNGTLTL